MKKEAIKRLRVQIENSEYGNVVHGEGNIEAKLVLVGEAPGSKEVELSRPFVGQAGKNLDEFLGIVEIERSEIYITNVVKTRPFKINAKTGRKNNRPPNKEELMFFKGHLHEELKIIEPRIVVTLGNTALRAVTVDEKLVISDVHGRPLEIGNLNFEVFPLYHPAAVIYNRSLRPVYIGDLDVLKAYIKK
ncbi:MAG: uracil-DNA glycosylase [Peptostreptococcaceae bacterium]|nr:uracil-DNA glycosylase [Peptostreptococcaceae bacterium]